MSHGHGAGPIDPAFDPADPEYGATPQGSTYEHTDAHTGTIVRFMFWLAVLAILTHLGIGVMYRTLVGQAAKGAEAELRSPLAADATPELPPLPRLQASPANEIHEFRLQEADLLNSYGWNNKAQGTVHIPIADAMRMTVERGLPSRAVDAATPAEVPGLVPTDASAGRVMERRRQ